MAHNVPYCPQFKRELRKLESAWHAYARVHYALWWCFEGKDSRKDSLPSAFIPTFHGIHPKKEVSCWGNSLSLMAKWFEHASQ